MLKVFEILFQKIEALYIIKVKYSFFIVRLYESSKIMVCHDSNV